LASNTLTNQNLYTMKKLLLLLVASLTMLFWGCTQFDDSRIWDAIDELEDLYDDLDGRLEDLEEACEKMNTNIEALQTLVSALQNNDTITSIAPIKQGDKVVGYTITFSKSEPITIYHGNDGKDGANGADGQDGANGADGKDGKDGYTPQIGVAKDSDNVYYWTLDGEWLLDESGNKIKAVGTDGKDGEDGANGTDGKDGADGSDGKDGENGADGKDGITPQLEIREGYWWISYDNGATWKELGKATGEDGKDGADGEDGKDGADGANGSDGQDGKDGADGDSLFQSVTWDEGYAYFTLADGTTIKIPLSEGAVERMVEVTAVDIAGYWVGEMCLIALSDKEFHLDKEVWVSYNSQLYGLVIIPTATEDTSVAPIGTYSADASTILLDESVYRVFTDNDQTSMEIIDAFVTISENAIDVTVTLENGEVHHVVYDGSLELNWIGGGEEEDTPTPPANAPANEIWYTSTYGEVVEPYDTTAFGANIVSNTYENGVGIITFDGDVTSIGDYAFYYCSSLAGITIPDSVTSIGDWAFYSCSRLASVTIPDGVTEIGDYAFAGSESLASVSIGNGVTSIGGWAFNHCSSLASVTIPDGVTEIGDYAFYGCSSLTITIPDSVTSIGDGVFAGSMSLAEFNGKFASSDGRCLIIDGVLNSFAPAGVTEYTISDSVTSIGDYAFGDCTSLASVTIPDSVTSIGDGAFDYCESLASVYCKATTPPSLDGYVFFKNASERMIYVPAGSEESYKTADYWSNYAYYIVGYDFE